MKKIVNHIFLEINVVHLHLTYTLYFSQCTRSSSEAGIRIVTSTQIYLILRFFFSIVLNCVHVLLYH